MTIAKGISAIGLIAMTLFIGNAILNGDFANEGAWLLAHPWGQVSMVDLYVGFAIFSMWIIYREKSPVARVVWVVLMLTLGNWTAALYTLLALNASNGDWQKFFHGPKA
jgi:hypothetical protein